MIMENVIQIKSLLIEFLNTAYVTSLCIFQGRFHCDAIMKEAITI